QRLLKRIEKMTAETSDIMNAMLHMPQVGEWATAGLFHDFIFSAKGDLVDVVEAGYDSRWRIRFKFKGTPVHHSENLSFTQKRLVRFMKALNSLTHNQESQGRFALKTVGLKPALHLGLDLEIFALGFGQGYELRFDRVGTKHLAEIDVDEVVTDIEKSLANKQLNRAYVMGKTLVEATDKSLNEKGDFILETITPKFTFDAEVGISLVSLEKSVGLELHFMRGEQ